MFKPSSNFLTDRSKAMLFCYLCPCLSLSYCLVCIVVTCWERADLLALLCVMFSLVFDTFPDGVLGQVWYLILSIPDICVLALPILCLTYF